MVPQGCRIVVWDIRHTREKSKSRPKRWYLILHCRGRVRIIQEKELWNWCFGEFKLRKYKVLSAVRWSRKLFYKIGRNTASFFKFFFKIFYCYSITVVCLFSPSLHPAPAKTPSLPHLHPPPWFCPCVLYSSSSNPLSPLSPLVIVRLFLTSMSLVIFCFIFFLLLIMWS